MALATLQIHFFRLLTDLLRKPPAYLKAPQQRGTFFARLPRRAQRLTLPQLFRRFEFLLQVSPHSILFTCPASCSVDWFRAGYCFFGHEHRPSSGQCSK